MQWLAELCVRRPVLASVISLVIIVVGSAFYTQLGVDQYPKIDFPAVIVITTLPGSSPEDVERDVTDKIEGAVNTISGIDELRSMSSEGLSYVMIQFKLEKNVDVAAQEVQQKVSAVMPELPRGVDAPVVQKFDPDSMPVLFVALNATTPDGRRVDVKEISDIADRVVRRRLESVSGVGQVVLIGARKRQILVEVDPLKLRALNMTAGELAAAIGAQNITLPGGRLDTSRDYLTLRVAGRVASIDELRGIIVREQEGRAVRLDEVAEVKDGVEEVTSSATWNDEPTVLLGIRKQSGSNTVLVVDKVKERMEELKAELPAGYALSIQRDGSAVIRTGIESVTEHLVLGAILAAIVVLLFLGNFRSTFIAAVAIPTSIIGTFAFMKLLGYTLNSITLLALALAVGIVIDDAIVVLENIFKKVEEDKLSAKEAAVLGTREIGPAVLATTLSLIAVFMPIAFVAGIPGRFLASFGVTMSVSIAVSLFVSFSLTPMLASQLLRPTNHTKGLAHLVDLFYRPIERAYMVVLRFSMANRWVVVVASLAALFAMGPLTKAARKGFLPIDDRAQFEVVVRLPEGRSVAATELVGQRVSRMLRELPEVKATLTTVGDDASRTPNLARVYVKLVDPGERKLSQEELKDVVRQKILPTLPKDWRASIADVNEFGGGQTTHRIQVLLAGPDLEVLERANGRILERIHQIEGAADVDSTLVSGKPELEITVNRERAADLGVQVADVANALQLMVAGQKVSTYSEGGEQYEVRLRATDAFRSQEDQLRLLTVASRKLGQVALADVVDIKPSTGFATINRYMRERQVTFLMNGKPGADESKITEAVFAAIAAENLPKGFAIKPQGQTKLMKETGISFILGLLASMVFMYLILAAQFESWIHPVTILMSLPLTLPFAILSVIIFKQALDLYSFLGIFVLFGVVKKNGILQIDHTNNLREKYREQMEAEIARAPAEEREIRKRYRLEAILKGNKDRLRPILMTTFAFVAGMIPLLTSQGVGAGFNRATAGVVVGGQTLSLVLTLLAVPVAYSFFDDLSVLFWRAVRWVKGSPRAPEATGLEVHGK